MWMAAALFGLTPPCDSAGSATGVVINEVAADADGADAGREWVELTNTGDATADLSGWVLAAGTAQLSPSQPFPPGTALAPGAYLVVGQEALPEVDLVAPGFSLGNAGSNSDAVQLQDCEASGRDTVIYGAPNTDAWLDDTGAVAVNTAPAPSAGGSLARRPDGHDTDEGGDFVAVDEPTPGQPNTAPPVDCAGPASGVTLNELFVDPAGADAGLEWVELFHAGTQPAVLDGWTLQAGTSAFAAQATLQEVTLAPGEFLILDGELSLGNATSSADGVRLVDCVGNPVDTVVYGAPNDGEPPFPDDVLEVAESLAPPPGTGESLQRIEDGLDTDHSGDDFALTRRPTPGEPNAVLTADQPLMAPGSRGCGGERPDAPEPGEAPDPDVAPDVVDPGRASMLFVVFLAGARRRRPT